MKQAEALLHTLTIQCSAMANDRSANGDVLDWAAMAAWSA